MTSQCDAIRDNLAAYQKGDITPEERTTIAAHLRDCGLCRQEAVAQQQMREQLRTLRQLTERAEPGPHIWTNVMQGCNRHDAARRIRVRLRFTLAAACLFVFAYGAVWARLNRTVEFPTSIVLNDYLTQEKSPTSSPKFPTPDADKAASWLSHQLGVDIPVINFGQMKGELLGADVLPTTPATGRLLYRTPQRLTAIYIVPHGTAFNGLKPVRINNYQYSEDMVSNKRVGLLGWHHGVIGYGMVMQKPIENGRDMAITAWEETQ